MAFSHVWTLDVDGDGVDFGLANAQRRSLNCEP